MVPTPFYALKMGMLTAMLTGLCASGYAGVYTALAAPTQHPSTNYREKATAAPSPSATPGQTQSIIIDNSSVGLVVVPTPVPTPTPTPTPEPPAATRQSRQSDTVPQQSQSSSSGYQPAAPQEPQQSTQDSGQTEEEPDDSALNQNKSGIQRSGEVQAEEKHALEYNGTVSESGW